MPTLPLITTLHFGIDSLPIEKIMQRAYSIEVRMIPFYGVFTAFDFFEGGEIFLYNGESSGFLLDEEASWGYHLGNIEILTPRGIITVY